MQNIEFYFNPDKHGFYNCREYKGIVTAISGNTKAFARCYLPDVYNEELGMAIAKKRLRIKLLRAEEIKMNEAFDYMLSVTEFIEEQMYKLGEKIDRNQVQQERLHDELIDMFAGMME